jgi:mannose-6-phosphate isomerase-like protein (cupin superfamily)
VPGPRPVRVAHLDDLEAVTDDGLTRVAVRRALGIQAFGVNAFTAAAEGDELVEDHDELGTNAGHHEELYLVLRGRATFTVDGETFDAPAGTLVFCPDPAARRHAVAAEGGSAVVVIGGVPGEAYRASPWDLANGALERFHAGEREAALADMEEGLRTYPDHPMLLYNLACLESLDGRGDAAVAHLRQSLELDGDLRRYVAGDQDLDPIRGDPRFPGS